ncbi:hypothetical protein KY359_01105 [Candidatus Woesearchaeota archaeon]|nr:hypothetical protein [Candidatus Woesearchaeota archaeon]
MPSLRERKRYIAFEIVSETPITEPAAVYKAIMGAALENLGVIGCAEAGIIMLNDKYDKEKQRGLMRVNNRSMDKVRGTLALITQIDNQRVIVKSRGVSGILRKAEDKYIAG